MKKKIVYRYDEVSKILLGPMECQPSPLEKDKEIFIVPAHSTEIAPPAQRKYEVLMFAGDRWERVANFLGVSFWDKKTKEKKVITELGKKPTKGWTEKEPGPDDKWDETLGSWVFNQRFSNLNIDVRIKELRMALFSAMKDIKQAQEFGMKDVEEELKAQADFFDKEIRALAKQKK